MYTWLHASQWHQLITSPVRNLNEDTKTIVTWRWVVQVKVHRVLGCFTESWGGGGLMWSLGTLRVTLSSDFPASISWKLSYTSSCFRGCLCSLLKRTPHSVGVSGFLCLITQTALTPTEQHPGVPSASQYEKYKKYFYKHLFHNKGMR